MINAVPGPRIRAGTNHRLPSSSICRFTASRNRTRERVSVATISRTGSLGSILIAPKTPLPSNRPKLRKISGNDRGDRSTRPETKAVKVRVTAIRPMINKQSGSGHLLVEMGKENRKLLLIEGSLRDTIIRWIMRPPALQPVLRCRHLGRFRPRSETLLCHRQTVLRKGVRYSPSHRNKLVNEFPAGRFAHGQQRRSRQPQLWWTVGVRWRR